MATNEQQVMRRLQDCVDELCMEIAELDAEAADHRDAVRAKAIALRERIGKISRMAGLGDLPEARIERHVRRVG